MLFLNTGPDACGCPDHNINCKNLEYTDRAKYPWDRVLVKGEVDHGGSQDSCRLRFYAAFFRCFGCAESRSGLRLTTRMGDQLRVSRDQRSGCSALAAS